MAERQRRRWYIDRTWVKYCQALRAEPELSMAMAKGTLVAGAQIIAPAAFRRGPVRRSHRIR